jgi:hypothetical protein
MPFIPEDKSDIFDPRLKSISMQCPDCDALIYGSGRMEWNALTQRWLVEFWCPLDKNHLLAWNEEYDSRLRLIATDYGY